MAHLLLALILACAVAVGQADPYFDLTPAPMPAAPPPSKVAGKVFPPDVFVCNDPNSKCAGKSISCPGQCPAFKPANPNEKACFIDCNNPKCEGVCGKRKPNCNDPGSACKDPRFVGGDGVVFYFRGRANEHFALVSDASFHINARFIGLRPANRRHDFTWIQSLSVLFGRHSLTLSATPAAAWDPAVDHFALAFDGQPIDLPVGHRATWSTADLLVERIATANAVAMALPGAFEIRAEVVPVTAEDDRIHRYNVPRGDCFAHLDVQFKFFGLSENVEGVLGQTYRANFQNPVKRGVAMPIMSGEEKYLVSSLEATDCKMCVFSPEGAAAAELMDASGTAFDCTSKMRPGYGVVCRR